MQSHFGALRTLARVLTSVAVFSCPNTKHATLVLFAAKNTHQQALWESKPAFGWHALHICSEIYLPKQSEEDCFASHSTTSAICEMTDSASATCPLNSQYQEADPFTLHFQKKHTPSLSIGTCWRHGRCFLSPWLSWTRQKEEPGKTNSVKIYLLQNTSWVGWPQPCYRFFTGRCRLGMPVPRCAKSKWEVGNGWTKYEEVQFYGWGA